MRVIAIDPGPTMSGVVLWDGRHVEHAVSQGKNEELFSLSGVAGWGGFDAVVFEQIESFGMAVGVSVFETVFQTGMMFREFQLRGCRTVARLPRRTVKLHLCGSPQAKDGNIRQALVDRFEPDLKPRQRPKGALKGVSTHAWAALALAVTFYDLHTKEKA